MKKIVLVSAIILMSVSGAFSQEWVDLFNGKNLKGWRTAGGKARFEAKDGVITGYNVADTPNTFLITEKTYGDFILEFEFRMDDEINSGIQFRSHVLKQDNGREMVFGYQYEMDPAPRAWTGGIYDEARAGWLYPLTFNPSAGSAYKNREWNTGRIEAYGNSIRTWVNGTECSNLLDATSPDGIIGLQVHSIGNREHEGKIQQWKNIRICTKDVEKHLTPDNGDVVQANRLVNVISERESAEGWRLLWDGKTNSGWRGAKLPSFPESGWEIKDGILKVQPGDGGESTNGGDIVTVDTYRNFKLMVDFKLTHGANSGIKYFVKPDLNTGEGSAIGCEFQILDDARHPDAKMGVNGNRTVASLYDLIPPERGPLFFCPDWSWNTAMVVVEGNHVEHWLNGVKVVEYERNNQMWNALVAYSKYRDWPNFGNHEYGHILLQDHGDEVSFRNVKILELP